MTYWHDSNPWHERAVYVPVDELASALRPDVDPSETLAGWMRFGDRLDAYVLRDSSGYHAGIRYGGNGPDYLSPTIRHVDRIEELYDLHTTPAFLP